MIPSSAISKSRAILIYVLIIGALAEVSAYYYVENEYNSSRPSASPASFHFANLIISPIEAGEWQPITISVAVTNVGDLPGSILLNLTINDLVQDTKMVFLSGNETKTVTFTATKNKEGSYNVIIGDQTGTFTIKAIPQPMPKTLKVSKMFIDPLEAWPDQLVYISVEVNNTGSENISYRLPLLVNGTLATTVKVELAPGATATVTITTNESSVGKYLVSAGGYRGSQFKIVPNGKHTLHYISSRPGLPYTLDGTEHKSQDAELLDVDRIP